MKKIIIIIIISILNITVVSSQTELAKDILEKLKSTTESYNNISIDFIFLFQNKSQKIEEKQEGHLIIEKEKFRLEMNEQTIINDGETQWVYLNDLNEVQIMEHDSEDEMMSPIKLLTIYEKNYKYNYIESTSEDGKRLHIIDFFPKEREEFMKINIAVNALKNQLERIILYDKNGGTYTYSITSFIINKNDKPFTFNITDSTNIEIIDLR